MWGQRAGNNRLVGQIVLDQMTLNHVAGVYLPLGLHVCQAGSKFGHLILLDLIDL